MNANDQQLVKEICNNAIDDRVNNVKTIVKWSTSVASVVLLLVVSGWMFMETRTLFRYIHDSAFPVAIPQVHISPDTVLITAYSKDFILKEGDPTVDESDFITFYAEPGQKVQYIINVKHRFFSEEARRRQFFVEIDGVDVYHAPIVEHAGGLRVHKLIDVNSPDREEGLHRFGFKLNRNQTDYDPRGEVFITCIILVSGKQYSL